MTLSGHESINIDSLLSVYGRDGLEIVLIQQRSPTQRSMKQEFTQDLFDFVRKSAFSSVLILSGVDLSNRLDEQML